ncbi:hypothetical protein AZI87_06115 [Bdellovibrio bacteriovorus]|uniref:Uncharacterized protein n=1 Tax=Bdellovibrio bacteriovorus TaxID=959 RepID=A0A162GRR8_BDEBC|nr:hypothetical protein AZI87_06115 [Bdellovibrio bacteriovorus]
MIEANKSKIPILAKKKSPNLTQAQRVNSRAGSGFYYIPEINSQPAHLMSNCLRLTLTKS